MAKNFLYKYTEHRRHIRMAGYTNNNNQMESFNWNTLRFRGKAVRGIKKRIRPYF